MTALTAGRRAGGPADRRAEGPVADAFDRLAAALADRYRIERELGQEGMAAVCLAWGMRESRAEARAGPRNGVLKDAHASASRCLAEPALQSGTPSKRERRDDE